MPRFHVCCAVKLKNSAAIASCADEGGYDNDEKGDQDDNPAPLEKDVDRIVHGRCFFYLTKLS